MAITTFSGIVSGVDSVGDSISRIELAWILVGVDNAGREDFTIQSNIAVSAAAATSAGRGLTWNAGIHDPSITAFQAAGQTVNSTALDIMAVYIPAVRVTELRTGGALVTGDWSYGPSASGQPADIMMEKFLSSFTWVGQSKLTNICSGAGGSTLTVTPGVGSANGLLTLACTTINSAATSYVYMSNASPALTEARTILVKARAVPGSNWGSVNILSGLFVSATGTPTGYAVDATNSPVLFDMIINHNPTDGFSYLTIGYKTGYALSTKKNLHGGSLMYTDSGASVSSVHSLPQGVNGIETLEYCYGVTFDPANDRFRMFMTMPDGVTDIAGIPILGRNGATQAPWITLSTALFGSALGLPRLFITAGMVRPESFLRGTAYIRQISVTTP